MLKLVASSVRFRPRGSSYQTPLLSRRAASFVSQQMFYCLALWCKVASVEVGTLAASFEFSPIEYHQPPSPHPQATQRGALPFPLSPLTPCRPHSCCSSTFIMIITPPPLEIPTTPYLSLGRAFTDQHPPPHTYQKPIYRAITAAWACISKVHLHLYTFTF